MQLKLKTFHETLKQRYLLVNISNFTQGIFYSYRQSKDMADFHNLQGILEFPDWV